MPKKQQTAADVRRGKAVGYKMSIWRKMRKKPALRILLITEGQEIESV